MATHHQEIIDFIHAENWHQAHALAQDFKDPLSCLLHGYLHWQEGDLSNADYWYQRAGEIRGDSFENELERITQLVVT